MIDRNDLKCPACGSFSLRQGTVKTAGRVYTIRKERESKSLEIDNICTLECKPADPTWYGCIMCNTEFDGDGNEYAVRKMYPFCKSKDGMLD